MTKHRSDIVRRMVFLNCEKDDCISMHEHKVIACGDIAMCMHLKGWKFE